MRRHRFVIAIALLASLLAMPIMGCAAECGCDGQQSCCSCVTTPLCCGNFSIMVKGGIAPALYKDRGPNWVVIPTNSPAVFTTNSAATFPEQFHLPWTVGAEAAYKTSRRGRFFLEYAYTQASGKLFGDNATVGELFSDYRTHSGYLGARYYFDPWCCGSRGGPISPYVGLKVGLVWQQQVTLNLTIGNTFILSVPYSLSKTAISGGLQIGGEWWFSRCWSLVLQGDFIATQGPCTNPNLVFPTDLGIGAPSNVFTGTLGWVVTFPVTLGLRWTF